MKRHKKPVRRLTLSVPAIRKLREAIERGNIGGWAVEAGEDTNAGSVCIRYTLKHKPWIVTVKAEYNHNFKKR